MTSDPIRGRGTDANPATRFDAIHYEADDEHGGLDDDAPRTKFIRDDSQSIIARNNSPDVGFDASINPYRGCEHGCAYCYARPTHEYLGLSAGLDFETTILVKERAPELLRRELASKRWRPQVIGISGVTDPYQPVERRLRITRQCLEVLAEFRNPVAMITKNHLVTRDSDLLARLAADGAASVCISITTLDPELRRRMEPRTSTPRRRLDAIRHLADAGVPVGVLVGPVIPGLTDHELPAIVAAAADAGAQFAGHIVLRLPHGVKDLFADWLERTYPTRKDRVLDRVRAVRDGGLNDSQFGRRMQGQGIFAQQIHAMFEVATRKAGIGGEMPELSVAAFRRPGGEQLELGLG